MIKCLMQCLRPWLKDLCKKVSIRVYCDCCKYSFVDFVVRR